MPYKCSFCNRSGHNIRYCNDLEINNICETLIQLQETVDRKTYFQRLNEFELRELKAIASRNNVAISGLTKYQLLGSIMIAIYFRQHLLVMGLLEAF